MDDNPTITASHVNPSRIVQYDKELFTLTEALSVFLLATVSWGVPVAFLKAFMPSITRLF